MRLPRASVSRGVRYINATAIIMYAVFAAAAQLHAQVVIAAPDRAWFDTIPGIVGPPAPRPWTRQSRFIVMRDGVRLAADLYLPGDRTPDQRLATILEQTRYHRSDRRLDAEADAKVLPATGLIAFVNTGYAVLVVDVRGTGASFGTRRAEFAPEEIRDGWDVVEWIIRQPWSDGAVGATGVSYPGTTAEFVGTLGHPAVKAVAPRFSLFDFYADVMFPGGAFLSPFFRAWESFVDVLDANQLTDAQRVVTSGVRPAADGTTGNELLAAAIVEHAANGRIFEQMSSLHYRDDITSAGLSIDTLSPHTHYRTSRHQVPTYSVSGWVDGGFGYGAIKRYLAQPGPDNRLTIGPWNHGGAWAYLPGHGASRTSFAHIAALRRFFDWHLRGIDTGIATESPVHYFITGENRWVASATWPPATTSTVWYLAPRGTLTTSDSRRSAIVGSFTVDTTLGTGPNTRWNTILGGGQVNYPPRASIPSGAVAFTTAPLARALVAVGHPVVILHGRYSTSDPTLFAYLEEVDSTGAGQMVTEGQLRLVNRKIGAAPRWYPAPQAYHTYRAGDTLAVRSAAWTEARFELLPLAHQFAVGSRIRLVITGSDRDHFAIPNTQWTAEFRQSRGGASRVVLPILRIPARNNDVGSRRALSLLDISRHVTMNALPRASTPHDIAPRLPRDDAWHGSHH